MLQIDREAVARAWEREDVSRMLGWNPEDDEIKTETRIESWTGPVGYDGYHTCDGSGYWPGNCRLTGPGYWYG